MLSALAFAAASVCTILLIGRRNLTAAFWAFVTALHALSDAIPYLLSLGG